MIAGDPEHSVLFKLGIDHRLFLSPVAIVRGIYPDRGCRLSGVASGYLYTCTAPTFTPDKPICSISLDEEATMSVSNNSKGNRIQYHYWDYSFEWTDDHTPGSDLDPWTRTCDTLADEAIAVLDALPAAADDPTKRDRYALLRDNHGNDKKLEGFWTQLNTPPEWVDWEQIQRGQDIFWRYLIPITSALAFASLLGGMGGIRVGETLTRTGGFGAKVVHRRLLETVQHTIQVNRNVDSMKPGGEGHLSSVRIRLLHSAVRRRIMSLIEQDASYYDLDRYGVPINDLDCCATINVFSSTVIWLGLPRQGIYLTAQEEEDYIALWRLVAHYMGAPTDPFESAAKAKIVFESFLVNEYVPSDTGRILARNIAIGLENTAPIYASIEYMDAMTRLLNGDQLSDELHIPKTNLYYRVLMWGYCFWVQLVAKTIPLIPALDRHVIQVPQRTLLETLNGRERRTGQRNNLRLQIHPVPEAEDTSGRAEEISLQEARH
ncbi:hypothetical protein BJX61DRAFT_215140 [Aspergillus egyptiacus]|nr:hypothetical protein BJX61DRAFT_215140 [Aspergillus egyptiacus]